MNQPRPNRFPVRAILFALWLLPGALAAQTTCGVQRWPVKIWADYDAAKVDTVPVPITVAELVSVPRPQTSFPQRARVPGAELQTFLLRARFVGASDQDDSDIHVVVRDLEIDQATLVTEIPHPGCTEDERLKRVFTEARLALRTVPRDAIIEIVGLGFFDSDHGQRGMAPNGIEIHPVLSLRVIDATASRPMGPVGLLSSPLDSAQFTDTVWVNSSSGVYHCRATTWYGRTLRGYFVPEREAMRTARPAGGRRCRARG